MGHVIGMRRLAPGRLVEPPVDPVQQVRDGLSPGAAVSGIGEPAAHFFRRRQARFRTAPGARVEIA